MKLRASKRRYREAVANGFARIRNGAGLIAFRPALRPGSGPKIKDPCSGQTWIEEGHTRAVGTVYG